MRLLASLSLPRNIWEAGDFSGLILCFSNWDIKEIYLDFSFRRYLIQLKDGFTNNWRCFENNIWQKRGCCILFLQSSIDSECWALDLTAFISWRSANNPLDDYNRETQTDSSCPHLIKLRKRHKNKLMEEQTERECKVCARMRESERDM